VRRLHCQLPPCLHLYIILTHLVPQRDERVIVVWSDSFDGIIPLCRDFEAKLIKLVWRCRRLASAPNSSASPASAMVSKANFAVKESVLTESIPVTDKERNNARSKSLSKKHGWGWSWRASPEKQGMSTDDPDLEKEGSSATKGPRPIRLYAPFYCGLATALSICKANICHLLLRRLILAKFSLVVVSASFWPNGCSTVVTLGLSCSSHLRSYSVYHW
jgi:hypothetical protein